MNTINVLSITQNFSKNVNFGISKIIVERIQKLNFVYLFPRTHTLYFCIVSNIFFTFGKVTDSQNLNTKNIGLA